MKTVLEKKLTCPKCRMPVFYGWESLEQCAMWLRHGVTRKGKDGCKQFKWLKCGGCGHKMKISGLRL